MSLILKLCRKRTTPFLSTSRVWRQTFEDQRRHLQFVKGSAVCGLSSQSQPVRECRTFSSRGHDEENNRGERKKRIFLYLCAIGAGCAAYKGFLYGIHWLHCEAKIDTEEDSSFHEKPAPMKVNLPMALDSIAAPDAIIHVEGKTYNLHKIVLCSHASVLKELLRSRTEITIENISQKSMDQLVNYMYTQAIPEEISADFLRSAEMLGLTDIFSHISPRLLKGLTVENVSDRVKMAVILKDEKLFNKLAVFFVLHREEIMQTKEWQQLRDTSPSVMNNFCCRVNDIVDRHSSFTADEISAYLIGWYITNPIFPKYDEGFNDFVKEWRRVCTSKTWKEFKKMHPKEADRLLKNAFPAICRNLRE